MRLLVLLLLTAALAGCVEGNLDTNPTPNDVDNVTEGAGPYAVIGLQDNGINAYHITFRDDSPQAFEHPSTYIDGYPGDAIALELTFNATDFWSAVHADCEAIWSTIEAGQMYWFPGTKIIGAITFQDPGTPDCTAEEPFIGGILSSSHGTMTASRAASNEYGACPECHIVMVEGFNVEGVRWLGANAHWIDVQSHSWGPFLPVREPGDESSGMGIVGGTSNFYDEVDESASKHLAFWASGNGAGTRFGVLGHPSILTPHFGPSVVTVGGHDSGYINTWPGWWAHVVSDSCDSWAAHHTNLTSSADNVGGGTSGATPYAAGIAADILLEARRLLGDHGTGVEDGVAAHGSTAIASGPLADGTLTLDEWRDLVMKTATPRPERQHEDGAVCSLGTGLFIYDSTPIMWNQVPDGYPQYLHIGYGATDNVSRELAHEILAGTADMPLREQEDMFFAADAQARQVMHDVWTTGP